MVATSTGLTFWVKMGNGCNINRMFLYYTTDGATWPEGAGGEGRNNTQVKELQFVAADSGRLDHDWWGATLTGLTNGTPLRYKIGGAKFQGCQYACNSEPGCGWDVPFPNDWNSITRKTKMMGVWEVTNFNASAAPYFPHVDYGVMATGLVDGFHVLNARAFLDRAGRAPIFNTFVQTFYLDAQTPSGSIIYPASDGQTLTEARATAWSSAATAR